MTPQERTKTIYAKSPLTGNFYRVERWTDYGDGKVQAKEKTEVDRKNVPDEWLDKLEQ